jgi:hypothetical protein
MKYGIVLILGSVLGGFLVWRAYKNGKTSGRYGAFPVEKAQDPGLFKTTIGLQFSLVTFLFIVGLLLVYINPQ